MKIFSTVFASVILLVAWSAAMAIDDVFPVERQSHGRWTYTYNSVDGDQFVNLNVFASASDNIIFPTDDDGGISLDDQTTGVYGLSATATAGAISASIVGDIEAYSQLDIFDISYDAEVNNQIIVSGSMSGPGMAEVAYRGDDTGEISGISFNRLLVGPGSGSIPEGTMHAKLTLEWDISTAQAGYMYAFVTELNDRPDSWIEAELITGTVTGGYSNDTTANPTAPGVVGYSTFESPYLGSVSVEPTTVVVEDDEIELYTYLGNGTSGLGTGPLSGGENWFHSPVYSAELKATATLVTISD